MKINQSVLKKALDLCKRVTPSATTLPILTAVCASNGKLSATNIDAWVSLPLPELEFQLDVKALHKIVKAVKGEIDISIDDTVRLQAENRTFLLPQVEGDWPIQPQRPEREPDFTFNNASLYWLLSNRYCTREDAANVLDNVLLQSDKDGRWSCAMDGSRMDVRRYPAKGQEYRILLPRGNADILMYGIAATPLNQTSCWIEMPWLHCVTGEVQFAFQLRDNKYPRFEQIQGMQLKQHVVVNKLQLQKAVALVLDLSCRVLHDVTMKVSKDKLLVELHDQVVGGVDITEVVACRSEVDCVCSYNSSKLLDCLKAIKSDFLELWVDKDDNPLFVKPRHKPSLFDRSEAQHTVIIMPLRKD